ncbi:MAG: S-layer homology domain-containing protein [Actinomycetota bacterium]
MFRQRISRFLILALVASAAVVLPERAVAQGEEPTFRFEGGGWGHGVGMSQYGALGRAEAGQLAEDIIAYYYDGTVVEERAETIDEFVGDGIRVNLGQGRPDSIRVTIDETRGAAGSLTATIGDQVLDGGSTLRLEQGSQVGDSVDGSLDTWKWIFEVDGGGDSCVGCLTATPVITWPEGVVVGIGEITGSSGGKPTFEYGTHDVGALHFTSRDVGETDGAFVVLHLPLDDYLHGLAEMPPTWHPEAMRAQAIAGRSYAVHRAIDRENADFDVFDSVQDQVYGGFDAKLGGRITAADTTSNIVVTVDDLIVQTFYSSSNGGYSESTENSGSFSATEPWHISKPDPFDAAPDEDGDPQNPFAFRDFEFTQSQVSEWLAEYSSADLDVGTVLKITVDELPPSGRITNALVTVTGTDRTLEIRGFDGDGGSNPDGPPFGLRFQAAIQRGCEADFGSLSPQCPVSSNFTVAGFFDIQSSDFFYDPVRWMAAEEITDGVGPNEFGPNLEVTRNQFAAFVHRFAGEPEPTEPHGFDDVPEGIWYDGPVAWMKENGITTGTTPTTFSPVDTVTRGQLATFLYRLAGEPEVEPSEQFADVPPGQFYTEAVAWMVEFGITNGTSPTTFSPVDVVTRGQIATFLYRLAGLPEAFAEGTELPAKMRIS